MISPLPGIVQRRLQGVVNERLQDEPVIALQGPRTVGKSTLLAAVAAEHGSAVLDLDDLAVRDAAAADPLLFVGGAEPVCIDEYQHVPELLDAIKSELNRDLHPGRYLLTGSTRYDSLPEAAHALTGRLHLLTVYPLSQRELEAATGNVVGALFSQPDALVAACSESATSRAEYIERVHAGGMPIALSRAGAARGRWIDDYVTQTLERDVRELARIRQREQLPRLLQRLAAQTAQVLNVSAAARESAMDSQTAENYLRLLEAVFLIQRLPAWGTTLRRRAAASPKVHVIDSGVAARLLRVSTEKLAGLDPTALTEFGHLLETFAVFEVIKQAGWLDGISGWGHWRTHDGDEVDLVIERDDGSIVALEIKSGSRVARSDISAMVKLRDAVGDTFVAGAVLYLGTRAYTATDRVHVLPLDSLWSVLP